MGGTGTLVAGLVRLIEGQGGAVRCNAPVRRDRGRARRATGVGLTDGELPASRHRRLERRFRLDLPALWSTRNSASAGPTGKIERARYSMSLFVWYFGTRRHYPDVRITRSCSGRATASCSTDIFERKTAGRGFQPLPAPADRDRSVARARRLRRLLRAVAGAASAERHRLEPGRGSLSRPRSRAISARRCCPDLSKRSSPRAC